MLLIHRSITAIVRYTALNYELHKIDDDDTDVDQFIYNSWADSPLEKHETKTSINNPLVILSIQVELRSCKTYTIENKHKFPSNTCISQSEFTKGRKTD